MATRKYKKIQSKTKKMKGSGNTTRSSKKNYLNKNKKNSQDDLDILESGNKSEHLLDLLERGSLSNAFKMIQASPHSINTKKTKNKPKTFKKFMKSIEVGNGKGAVSFGGSGKSNSKNSKNTIKYNDQKKTLERINRTLKNELDKLNINKNSSLKDIVKADDTNRYLKEVKKLEEINNLLKEYTTKGGKRVKKTRKYKR